MEDPTIERASAQDFDAVFRLLSMSNLPVADLEIHIDAFTLAGSNGTVVGTAGLEIFGELALLRSLCVAEHHRSKGIGGGWCPRSYPARWPEACGSSTCSQPERSLTSRTWDLRRSIESRRRWRFATPPSSALCARGLRSACAEPSDGRLIQRPIRVMRAALARPAAGCETWRISRVLAANGASPHARLSEKYPPSSRSKLAWRWNGACSGLHRGASSLAALARGHTEADKEIS